MTVTTAKRPPQARTQPDQRKLTQLQAERLATITDLDAKDLVGLTTSEISEKFRFHIEPELLLFRKICGRVVKTDPATGVDYPVPFATVHVQDTDCSLLGYFPPGSPWAWYFPFRCRREDLATVHTDECGNFCAWIPRWDIDHVLSWRHRRFCFPTALEHPSLRDVLEHLQPIEKWPPIGPGPVELPALKSGAHIKQLEDQLGKHTVAKLQRLSGRTGFGQINTELETLLDTPVFARKIAPPLPKEFRGTPPRELIQNAAEEDRTLVSDTLAERLQIDAADLQGLDLRNYLGPFKRCVDVLTPVWTPIIDVPDITFRVTQDTDGDGDQDTIYSEGYFQVRWNAGALGPVTLHANPSAIAGQLECLHHGVPCGTKPAIVLAGILDVNDPALYDTTNGYVLRANRPHTTGGPAPDPMPFPAATPFHGNVSLFGCNKTHATATHYRIVYKYSADGGLTYDSYRPMTGRSWQLSRLNGGVDEHHLRTADGNGWYTIAIPGETSSTPPFLPRDKLMDWPSNYYPDGRYVLKVELGNASGTVLDSSLTEIAFNIDNSAPNALLTVEWKRAGEGDAAFQELTLPCPVIRRGSTPVELEFRATLLAGARHLRSVSLHGSGCGGGSFVPLPGGSDYHWHENTGDNTETLQKRYRLSAAALQGTYSFSGAVSGRAMSPTGVDNGHLYSPPWQYDPDDSHTYPYLPFSVFNAD